MGYISEGRGGRYLFVLCSMLLVAAGFHGGTNMCSAACFMPLGSNKKDNTVRRELGAVDESSSWLGAQVVIPNYIQANLNCMVSTAHYLVCCEAECERLMGEIKSAIQAPEALPEAIVNTVRRMTSQGTIDHDEPAHLDWNIVAQLNEVAKNHEGMVPLHGLLFAQWLHYVFLHEYPFPHRLGTVSATTPSQYGKYYLASDADMKMHAANTTALDISVTKEELQWLSQWCTDEELMMDYSSAGRGGGYLFVHCSMLEAT